MTSTSETELFPAFRQFAEQSELDRAKGALSAVLPRILGQGKTRATDMDDPPAFVERKQELAGLKLPVDVVVPPNVQAEIDAARADVVALREELARPEGRRRFIAKCLEQLPDAKVTDGKYHVDSYLLVDSKSGFEWSWSLTTRYPVIQKLPPDPDYIARGLARARAIVDELVVAPDVFVQRLTLAWEMARHFAGRPEVPVVDVMRCYGVAAQDDRFWAAPKKAVYRDLPEAAFVANVINWRKHGGVADSGFTFVPASLNDAMSKKVFHMPMNAAGTETRPMLYLKRRQASGEE